MPGKIFLSLFSLLLLNSIPAFAEQFLHKASCDKDQDCGIETNYDCCGITVRAVNGKNAELKLPDYPEVCTYSDFACPNIDSAAFFARGVACVDRVCVLDVGYDSVSDCLKGFGSKAGCIQNLAVKNKDSTICQSLKDPMEQIRCRRDYAERLKSPQECPDDFCIRRMVDTLDNPAYCEFHSDPDGCFTEFALAKRQPQLCEKVKNDSGSCFDQLAVKENNTELCRNERCRLEIQARLEKMNMR